MTVVGCRLPVAGVRCETPRARQPATGNRQQGFTLLEAVVALALIAAAALPLYAFFSRSLDGLYRAAEANRESQASLTAIAFLSGLNPMERPDGEDVLGPLRLRWKSRELVPAMDSIGYPRGMGLYQVALYEVTGEIMEQGRVRSTVSIRLIGHRRARQLMPFGAPQSRG
jgi:general secretion pathway protein I